MYAQARMLQNIDQFHCLTRCVEWHYPWTARTFHIIGTSIVTDAIGIELRKLFHVELVVRIKKFFLALPNCA